MTKHTIHYNVQNGGDGSAYPRFFNSAKLAAWDESRAQDGWGEPSVGSLDIDSDGPIKVSKLTTPESYLVELWSHEEEAATFVAEFFPAAFPHFTTESTPTTDPYHYIEVSADGAPVGRTFQRITRTAEMVAEALNALGPKQ